MKLRLEVELDVPDWERMDEEERSCLLDLLAITEDNLWHNNEMGEVVGNVRYLRCLDA